MDSVETDSREASAPSPQSDEVTVETRSEDSVSLNRTTSVLGPFLVALLPLLALLVMGLEPLRMAIVYGWPGAWSNPQSALNGEEELFGVWFVAIPLTLVWLIALLVSLSIASRARQRGRAFAVGAASALAVLVILAAASVAFFAL